MSKVLICDNVHSILIDTLRSAGFEVNYQPTIEMPQVELLLPSLTGIVINSKTSMFSKQIDKAKQLKFIGRLGSGMEIIDVAYAEQQGIACLNSPEGNRNAVAEHALGMLLNMFNKLSVANNEVKQFIWNREDNRGLELDGKTIGLIGYGNTGKAFAKKLAGFDVQVLAYDKYLDNYTDVYAKQASLDEIQEKAEVISLHIPLTEETHQLIDKAFIKKVKKPFFLINTSRGNHICLESLISALNKHKIMGACLDVFPNEKPHTYNKFEADLYKALFKFNNVLVSPHIAGWTQESKLKIGKVLAEKILKVVKK